MIMSAMLSRADSLLLADRRAESCLSATGPVAVAIGAQRVDSYMPGFGDEPAAERDPCSPVPPATSKKSPEEGRTERSTSA